MLSDKVFIHYAVPPKSIEFWKMWSDMPQGLFAQGVRGKKVEMTHEKEKTPVWIRLCSSHHATVLWLRAHKPPTTSNPDRRLTVLSTQHLKADGLCVKTLSLTKDYKVFLKPNHLSLIISEDVWCCPF